MVLNLSCFTVKSCLVQDQTVPGKDISNLLIADSLLKTICLLSRKDGIAKDVQNYIKDQDQDLSCVFGIPILQDFMKSKLKKHDIKQVQQSCLKEAIVGNLCIPRLKYH
ncbi:hypothetical protein Tco_1138264 [Tanacetum coccineum]